MINITLLSTSDLVDSDSDYNYNNFCVQYYNVVAICAWLNINYHTGGRDESSQPRKVNEHELHEQQPKEPPDGQPAEDGIDKLS